MQVIPATSPQDIKTEELISTLRDDVIPQALEGSGTQAYVGGATATFVDLGVKISERLPIFILVVIGLSVVVLMAVFRSILIPLKAAILNLLSFGAAYGVLVAVFQWGWAQDASRHRPDWPDRVLPADDALRDPLRPLDGLRGLSGLPHPRGLPARRQHPHGPAARHRRDGPGDHGGRRRSWSRSSWPSSSTTAG